MTLSDLYAVAAREYGSAWPADVALHGDRWVMDKGSFTSVLAACRQSGVTCPPDWPGEPGPEDRLFGLPVEVREGAGAPHVERGPR